MHLGWSQEIPDQEGFYFICSKKIHVPVLRKIFFTFNSVNFPKHNGAFLIENNGEIVPITHDAGIWFCPVGYPSSPFEIQEYIKLNSKYKCPICSELVSKVTYEEIRDQAERLGEGKAICDKCGGNLCLFLGD